MLDKNTIEKKLNIIIPSDVHYVAYQSSNEIKNTGNEAWKKDSGLLSIWLLGMMNPTPQTKVIIPFLPKPGATSYITDDYFGKISWQQVAGERQRLIFSMRWQIERETRHIAGNCQTNGG